MFQPKIVALLLLPLTAFAQSVTIPDTLYDGPVTAEAVSTAGNLDMPKLSPGAANETSFDWWYFDVVAADASQSVTVVFYNSGPKGFLNEYKGGPLSASVMGVLPNGTAFTFSAPASSAVVSRAPDSFATSGNYTDSGFAWTGTGLHGGRVEYVLSIDLPAVGVHGTVRLRSLAPPHYPCGADVAGAQEQILPHVFWSNAVPDAEATVELSIGGNEMKFAGKGYHDKNWGDTTFVATTNYWYWGHAHVGPYSIVWFEMVDSAGDRHTSGYISQGGKPLLSSCAVGVVAVTPWGANSTYPPRTSTGVMQGLAVEFDLGKGETFFANVTTKVVAVDVGIYVRTTGTVTGGLRGCKDEKEFDGSALFELFKFAP